MQPILFMLLKFRPGNLGVGPSIRGKAPISAFSYRVTGVTKDSTGAILGGCTCDLMRSSDKVVVDTVVSDANGVYEFRSGSPLNNYKVLAYKAGSPDVSGTTVDYLVAS